MSAVTITQKNFRTEVLESKTPVLVDFWADWCVPCRMLAPVVDQVAQEQAGALKVAKVNVDEEPQIAAEFGVVSIPTLLLFKGGSAVGKSVGIKPKQAVMELIAQADA